MRVLGRKAVQVPETQERLKLELYSGWSLTQFISYHDLILVGSQENLLCENDFADLIDNLRYRIGSKVDDILMASWLIDISIAVDSEIERLPSYEQRLVDRRQQHIHAASEIIYRDGKKTVITPCIACHDTCVADRTCLVREDNLPLQRIRQIHKLSLIEFQKSHVYKNLYFLQNQSASARQIQLQRLLTCQVPLPDFHTAESII